MALPTSTEDVRRDLGERRPEKLRISNNGNAKESSTKTIKKATKKAELMAARGRPREVRDKTAWGYKFWQRGRGWA